MSQISAALKQDADAKHYSVGIRTSRNVSLAHAQSVEFGNGLREHVEIAGEAVRFTTNSVRLRCTEFFVFLAVQSVCR